MTAKENVQRILRHDNPARIVQSPPCYYLWYQGCDHQGYEGGGHDCPVGSKWADIWGTEWHKEHADVMGFPRGNPLADMANLKTYQWPDPDDERICGPIYQRAKEFSGGDVFLCGSHRDTLWEKSYMLVGMEYMMEYLFAEPEYAREIFHRIMDFQLGIAKHYLAAGIEMAGMGDDLGTQNAPLLGPRIVAEFLEPEYRRLFNLYSERGVMINFHSCGNIASVLDTLMDLGVNILNPLQADANDLEAVRAKTRGRMALQGAVSTKTIVEGPVEKIVWEVRKRMWQLGRDGGYFCTMDQWMPSPQEHLDAFTHAVEEYGVYPICDPGECPG